MDIIEDLATTKNEKNKSKKIIEKNLANSLSLFNNQNFFRSDDLTVLDTVIMPILFRLPYFGIKIPSSNSAKALNEYIERMRDYKSFSESISESEKELLI
jgi:RNA polymerase-associated protein